MKKIFFITVLTLLCAIFCAFGLAACNNTQTPPHTHNYQWIDNGDGTHKQHCANEGCDDPDINSENHTWGANDKCEKCDAAKPVTHTHNYQWIDNGDGTHYRHCAVDGCDAPDTDSVSHDYGTSGTCVCGKKEPTQGIEYVLNEDGNSYSVAGRGSTQSTDIVIAEEYDGKRVTEVSEQAFKDSDITSLYVPKTVTKIGSAALSGCSSITALTLPFVGAEAANQQNAFLGYIFGESSYSDNANIPTSLKTVTVTGGELICPAAFAYCGSITDVVLPDGLKSISSGAFFECGNLTNVNIPDTVTSIGDMAFAKSAVTSIALPDGISEIKDEVFALCNNLVNISVPDSITNIDNSAFDGCDNLKFNEYSDMLYLGNAENPYVVLFKAKEAGSANCEIHKGTKYFYSEAFEESDHIDRFTVDQDNSVYSADDGILYNKAKTELVYVPKCISGTVTVSDGVTSIGEYAFKNRKSLTGIIIPDSVTEIKDYAFYGCDHIESMTLPFVGIKVQGTGNMYFGYIFGGHSNNNVPASLKTVVVTGDKDIGYTTFSDCINITTIKILGNVKYIWDSAFRNCTGLTSVTLPGSLLDISYPSSNEVCDSFEGCSNLTKIIFNGTTEKWATVKKPFGWNKNTGDYIVQCIGGNVNKNGDTI